MQGAKPQGGGDDDDEAAVEIKAQQGEAELAAEGRRDGESGSTFTVEDAAVEDALPERRELALANQCRLHPGAGL